MYNIYLYKSKKLVTLQDSVADLLPVFEEFMDSAADNRAVDTVRQSVVIMMGGLARHLDKDDPKVQPDQMNRVVLFWYLAISDFSIVPYCTVAYPGQWTITRYQNNTTIIEWPMANL